MLLGIKLYYLFTQFHCISFTCYLIQLFYCPFVCHSLAHVREFHSSVSLHPWRTMRARHQTKWGGRWSPRSLSASLPRRALIVTCLSILGLSDAAGRVFIQRRAFRLIEHSDDVRELFWRSDHWFMWKLNYFLLNGHLTQMPIWKYCTICYFCFNGFSKTHAKNVYLR